MSQAGTNTADIVSRDEVKAVKFIRRFIVFVVISTAFVLGWPIFCKTTSIVRAELPNEEIRNNVDHLNDKIHFKVPVYLDVPNSLEHFVPEAQVLLDTKLASQYPRLKGLWALDLHRMNDKVDQNNDYVVKFEYLKTPENEEQELPTESFFTSPFSKITTLFITDTVVKLKKVDDFLSVVLLDHVFRDELEQFSRLVSGEEPKSNKKDVVLPYSSKYNIIISLLTESGRSIDWEIEKSIALLSPVLEQLAPFANFTITTQIQYYSTLTNPPKFDQDSNAYIIPEYDLSTFINFNDWNLITHDINPSINFLVYFSESNYEHKPLLVENSKTNSFLVPQWGGVTVFNKDMPALKGHTVTIREDELEPIMEIFTSQLLELLGMVKSPKSLRIRFDALSRVTTFTNLKQAVDNLASLVKLTESLNEISIPELTQKHVLQTLEYFTAAIEQLDQSDFKSAVTLSAKSIESSDKAFFDKEMVQQAYFPSEHKLAVFLPLLGPVSSIMLIGLIKLLKDWKSERQSGADQQEPEAQDETRGEKTQHEKS